MASMTASRTEPASFKEPWHAELFALTMELSDNGHFTWVAWTEHFGAALRAASEIGGPQDGSNYYDVWLTALEEMLVAKNLASRDTLASLKAQWRASYEHTPHGEPVTLQRS